VSSPSRRSFAFFPSRAGDGPMERAFLFTRDIPLGVMPIRGSRDRPEYSVALDPPDPATSDWLAHFIHIGQFGHDRLDEALVEFVETATHYMAYAGEVFFEIVPGDGTSRPDQLAPLAPGQVRHLPGRYLQTVPKADRQAFDGVRFVTIPAEQMWQVKLPRDLATPRQHRRTLRRLGKLSRVMPDFALNSGDLGRSAHYDFTAHRKACEIGLERATNRWGTIPSLFQVEGTTEYYLFARRLQWQRSQAILREHLIAELNGFLLRLGVPHTVVVTGLPSPEQIEVTLRKLHAGEVDVAEAMKAGNV
jgi:hypothetical protein